MRKELILGLICSLLGLVSCEKGQESVTAPSDDGGGGSGDISLGEARERLEGILEDLNGQAGEESEFRGRVVDECLMLGGGGVPTRAGDSDLSSVYVFNFADDGGFAVMSGRADIPSLLALSYSGRYTAESVSENPGLGIFMAGVEALSAGSSDPDAFVPDEDYTLITKEEIVYKPGGYCSVTWNQGSPYNAYCPTSNGEHCPTGCVAVATAQLMSIYKQPASYGGYSFDWDLMTEKAEPTEGTDAADQIARLMVLLGEEQNLDMDYGVSSSSAYSSYIPRTLKNFGYSSGGTYEDYDINKIVSELKDGYSVPIRGTSHKTESSTGTVSYTNGHCWLCHGLLEQRTTTEVHDGGQTTTTKKSEWYLLCNWGWGGSCDGYFLSEAFDSHSGYAFPKDEGVKSTEGKDYYYQYQLREVTGIRK